MGKIIVIGGSQGGVQSLRLLMRELPSDFRTPMMVVQHIGASNSILPTILNDVDGYRADFAQDREAIVQGRVYVAPPDRHMIIEEGEVRLSRAPRENWARPAIDPLFRSAASMYGSEVIGILLSGRLN